MKKHIFTITFGMLLFSANIIAQEVKSISKSEVLSKVLEENTSIKISEQKFLKARAEYRQTNSVFLPSVSASHSGIATTNPLMAFGTKLNQGILTPEDFNPDLLNNPNEVAGFATKFEIQQPLINLDGFYQRKAAKNKMDAVQLQTLRTKDNLTFEVEKAYMQLQLAYKAVEVLEKTEEAVLENKKIAENSFKQGYLQRADVLSVDVRVSEVQNQLQSAKSNVQNASDYLKFLMNEKEEATLIPSDDLTVVNISNASEVNLSEERTDIKAMQLTTEAYESLYKANKMAFLPRLNAFGSYELYDENIFQGSASGYLVGAQLNWNLFDGYKNVGKTQQSKAQYDQSMLEYEQYVSQSNLDLNKAKRMVSDAENKLKLTNLALEQSKESLRIRTNRFKEGLEKTTDLLLAESQYAQKQLQYYQTIFEYNYAFQYLQFLTKE
ncbi:MAG: TolC family protein [Flavobacteriaceae bacterium]|nr:TolC family protein [Flavobacteriaceae bacterium]